MTRSIVVTGSSSGIGFEVARSFLAAGWNVVVNGRDAGKLRAAADRLGHADRVASVPGSTADAATGQALTAVARQRFGGLDMLVNNAGEFGAKPFVDVTEQDLDHYFAVNLKGTFLTTQAAVRAMRTQGRGGSIVNIGTVLTGHALAWLPTSAALVSKGGVHALTIALAAELAADRIRVNGVAPGFTRTPMMSSSNEPVLAAAALLGRVAEVQDIAAAMHYLADASFVTGQWLNVDGGFVSGRR